MTSPKAQKIKAIVKGTAPKSTFGTDPRDPWSAKSNVTEGNDLERYLKSRGINPAFVSTDTKIAHSKSGEFAKWKRDHQFEEVQVEQTATTKHTPTEIKAHELQKKTHKNNEIGDVKSEAWDQPDYNQSIKARQAEANKTDKEQSKDGVNKLVTKYREKNKKEHHVQEEVDAKDTVTMDIPFLIRVLELAREDVKDDADLHRVVEKLIEIRNKGTLTMDDYDFVAKLTEELDIPVLENEEMWVSRVIDEGKMGDLAGEIGRHLDKHIDDYKANGGAEHLGHKTVDTAKKIVKSHGLHPDHAQKFVNDYVEKRLSEEIQTKVQKHFGGPRGKDYNVKIDFTTNAGERGSHVHTIKNATSGKHAKHIAMNRHGEMFGNKHKSYGTSSQGVTELGEDVYQDSQAATQTSFDMGTSTDDTVQNRKRQMSKSARMVKAIYKKHKVNEEMYDHEKEDKSVASYGKKPKMMKPDDETGEDPDAIAILSGGKTLTGEPRDDVEIDPKMKTRPNQPESELDVGKDKKKDKQ